MTTLLESALAGFPVPRPPVWMMRQAGRFLPEYRILQERYPFFERIRRPELASQITRLPVDILGVDAAIIFSDILVVPQAMGCNVIMERGSGPHLPTPVRTTDDIDRLDIDGAVDRLHYVADAIRLTINELKEPTPLIGFAGAPWTILCYMIEGGSSKEWERARRFLVEQPREAERLLDMITTITIDYLRSQSDAGASALQIFDSWAAVMSPQSYRHWMVPVWRRLVAELPDVPLILFARGAHIPLAELADLGQVALGLDWTVDAAAARRQAPYHTLQGNLDPVVLFADADTIRTTTRRMISDLGVQRTIVNLGHGILPTTPVEGARVFINTVKEHVAEEVEV